MVGGGLIEYIIRYRINAIRDYFWIGIPRNDFNDVRGHGDVSSYRRKDCEAAKGKARRGMKTMIVIGLILTAIFTLPAMLFLFLYGAALIYRDLRERPDAKPLSKDEWKIM